jgi:2-hydroxychromene-2-carboxylate isomerase
MSSKTIHFYFDYLSPYAYFAWRRLPALAHQYNCQIEAHPVVFGKLLDKWGQLGPAEIPPKQQWLNQYCLRYAAINGFEYNPPKQHPFNPLAALRLSLKPVAGADQHRVISALFEAGWSRGADLGDLPTLIDLLVEQSIDGETLSGKVADPKVKDALVNETNMAIEKGVFGVPTVIVDGNLFWGNDQVGHLELLLSGQDPLDRDKLTALQNRPRAIDRKAFQEHGADGT